MMMVPQIEVIWKPFQLDPNVIEQGELLLDHCQRRWGHRDAMEKLQRLRVEGQLCGAYFNYWQYWPNTLRAHQWIQYGIQHYQLNSDWLNEILFHALYEQGMNISNVSVLIELAQRHWIPKLIQQQQVHHQQQQSSERGGHGLGSDDTNTNSVVDLYDLHDYLYYQKGAHQVQEEIQWGRRMYRIPGVPYFVIDWSESLSLLVSIPTSNDHHYRRRKPYMFSGAQSSETFLEIFQELQQELK